MLAIAIFVIPSINKFQLKYFLWFYTTTCFVFYNLYTNSFYYKWFISHYRLASEKMYHVAKCTCIWFYRFPAWYPDHVWMISKHWSSGFPFTYIIKENYDCIGCFHKSVNAANISTISVFYSYSYEILELSKYLWYIWAFAFKLICKRTRWHSEYHI